MGAPTDTLAAPGAAVGVGAVPAVGSTRTGPLAFLSQVPEDSLDVLLACELAFWLRPEALIDLARRSYLTLSSTGRLLVVVHSFAMGTPAPAWCAPPVVEKALDLAGFKETTVISLPGGTAEPSTHGYIAVARKS